MSKLKVLRDSAKLTQDIVANELGVTQGAVSQWEKGETFPSTENLIKLAALFKCTIDDLFENPKAVHFRAYKEASL